ncbi:hypothetical protein [Streptomyces chilikensis]|uniref:GIY-YIG nuclease family protein n=1 Tax=Streptomyces chilikensis TaxID=1194079 RepID=A0ABV3EZF0_9ACTN
MSNRPRPAPFHSRFRFDLTTAATNQLAHELGVLARAPLTERHLAELREQPGVYLIDLSGPILCIGTAEKSLPGRLRSRLHQLSGHPAIDITKVRFCCLYVDDLALLRAQRLAALLWGTEDMPLDRIMAGEEVM